MYGHEYISPLLLDVFHPAGRANCILHRYTCSFFRTFDTGIRKYAYRRIRYFLSPTIHHLYDNFWNPDTPFLSALAHEAALVFLDPSRLFRGDIAGCSRFLPAVAPFLRHALRTCACSLSAACRLFPYAALHEILRNISHALRRDAAEPPFPLPSIPSSQPASPIELPPSAPSAPGASACILYPSRRLYARRHPRQRRL